MKQLKKFNLARNLLTFLVTLSLIVGGSNIYQATQPKAVYAVGDLNVEWGVDDGEPIFVVENMLPGDPPEQRSVDVHNLGPVTRDVGIIGVKTEEIVTEEIAAFSTILDFVISENGTDLYGGTAGAKTLDEFFTDSAGPNGLFLSTLGPGDSTTYTFKATFPAEAGNEFQNAKVVFDLIIGISLDIPDECEGIDLEGTPIIGTSKAETITGTPGNDLIMGLEGADIINGNSGNDCIIGGPGAENTINGNNGDDVIFGNEGADHINGNNGDDLIIGGPGADNLNGQNGQDHLVGNEGADLLNGGNDDDLLEGGESADTLNGGNGNDELHGNNGVDTLNGGPGNDQLFGESGNDTLRGDAGNDYLDGGANIDNANGGPQTDTCIAESKTNCEI